MPGGVNDGEAYLCRVPLATVEALLLPFGDLSRRSIRSAGSNRPESSASSPGRS
jgi:hypothetical protein